MCPIIVKQAGSYGKKHGSKPHPFYIYSTTHHFNYTKIGPHSRIPDDPLFM